MSGLYTPVGKGSTLRKIGSIRMVVLVRRLARRAIYNATCVASLMVDLFQVLKPTPKQLAPRMGASNVYVSKDKL